MKCVKLGISSAACPAALRGLYSAAQARLHPPLPQLRAPTGRRDGIRPALLNVRTQSSGAQHPVQVTPSCGPRNGWGRWPRDAGRGGGHGTFTGDGWARATGGTRARELGPDCGHARTASSGRGCRVVHSADDGGAAGHTGHLAGNAWCSGSSLRALCTAQSHDRGGALATLAGTASSA
jgi:hypothetical protein